MSKLPSIGGDFVRAVEAMRAAQSVYFKLRTQLALRESIRLEKLVDSMIAGYNGQVMQVSPDGEQLLLTGALDVYNADCEED